jgi:hypothetical protein
VNTSKLKEPDTRSKVPKLLPVSNFSGFSNSSQNIFDIERDFLNRIYQATGSSPDSIIFNTGKFERIQNDPDISYIAMSWTTDNGKDCATLSYKDWSKPSIDGYTTINSWSDNDLKHFSEKERADFKADYEKRKKEAEEKQAIDRAGKTEEAKEIYEKFKHNKLTLENYKNTYLNDKGFTLDDLKIDPSLFLGNDFWGEFVGYPLYLNNEFVGIKRLYKKDNPKLKKDKKGKPINKLSLGLIGFHKLGNLEKENLDICFVAEGYATGLSVGLALNKLVFIADNCHKLKDCVKEVISQVRAINPNCLIVNCADKDKDKTGEIKAKEACKGHLGVICKLPKLYNQDLDKEKLDFDDTRTLEGLDSIRKQLDPEKLTKAFYAGIHEHNRAYIKFDKENGLNKPTYLTNFIFDLKYELKTSEGTVRYVQLLGQKETSKVIPFSGDIFTNTAEVRKFAYKQGKFSIESGLDLEKLRKHLINKEAPLVTPLEKVGRIGNIFYFGNCALTIGSKEVIKPDESGFFNGGYDDRGNKLAFCLTGKKMPFIDIESSKKDSFQLMCKLTQCVQEAYGIVGIMALAFAVAGFVREEIAEHTGTEQFPALFLYGDAKAGKSNLVNLILLIYGFKSNSGLKASSTKAVLRDYFLSSSSLAIAINDIKPDNMNLIENYQQEAYDGGIRAKKVRKNGDWVDSEGEPEAMNILDSNHKPTMESLLERILLLEFKKNDFKLEKAKELNVHGKKLSSIGRDIIQDVSLNALRENIVKFNDEYVSKFDSREALNAVYLRIGLQLLNRLDLVNDIDSFILSARDLRQAQKAVDQFFDYFVDKWLFKLTQEEKKNIEKKGNSLFIASSLINRCLQDFEEGKKGISGIVARTDIKDLLRRSSYCKDHNKNHRFGTFDNPKCYEFDLTDSSLPEALRNSFLSEESALPL